jgi:hypothetical protein
MHFHANWLVRLVWSILQVRLSNNGFCECTRFYLNGSYKLFKWKAKISPKIVSHEIQLIPVSTSHNQCCADKQADTLSYFGFNLLQSKLTFQLSYPFHLRNKIRLVGVGWGIVDFDVTSARHLNPKVLFSNGAGLVSDVHTLTIRL